MTESYNTNELLSSEDELMPDKINEKEEEEELVEEDESSSESQSQRIQTTEEKTDSENESNENENENSKVFIINENKFCIHSMAEMKKQTRSSCHFHIALGGSTNIVK